MALCLSRAQLSHGSHCDVVVNDGIPDRQGGSVCGEPRSMLLMMLYLSLQVERVEGWPTGVKPYAGGHKARMG